LTSVLTQIYDLWPYWVLLIIMLVEHMLYTVSLSLPTDSSIRIYTPQKKGDPKTAFNSTKKYEYLLVANSYCR